MFIILWVVGSANEKNNKLNLKTRLYVGIGNEREGESERSFGAYLFLL